MIFINLILFNFYLSSFLQFHLNFTIVIFLYYFILFDKCHIFSILRVLSQCLNSTYLLYSRSVSSTENPPPLHIRFSYLFYDLEHFHFQDNVLRFSIPILTGSHYIPAFSTQLLLESSFHIRERS